MKKLFIAGLALAASPFVSANITWTACPGTVASGEIYDVSAYAEWSENTSIYIYKNGSFFAYGQSYGAAYAGNSSTDYGNQTVNYTVNAYYTDYIFHDDSDSRNVTVVQSNSAPTIAWVVNPANAPVGEMFNVQARANDADGNLASVSVFRDGVPFALDGGGNGSENYSDLNGYAAGSPGPVNFSAYAQDLNGAYSKTIYWTVNVYQPNQSPDSPTISSGGVTQISLGQAVTLTGTLHDPDGNLAYHNLYYAAPGGGWVEILSGAPSNGTNSSLTAAFTPTTLGTWQFHTNGHDGQYWGPGATLSVNVVDGTAPTTPAGLSSGGVTGTGFTLSWAASSDNVGVSLYEVFRGGTSLGATGSTSLAVSGLTQGTAYSMTVRAKDAAGNWSPLSGVLVVNTTDTQAPSIPAGLASSGIVATSFTLSWGAAFDNLSVTAYEVMRGATSLGTTGSLSMAITGLTQGTAYPMTVRARDAAGNWSPWSTALLVTTTDTQPPSLPVGLASSGVTATGFTLNWNPSVDNVGVTLYEIRRDSISLGTTASTTFSASGLTQGTGYAMTVRARDAAGNWSAWSSVLAVTTTDTQAPTIPTGLSSSGATSTGFTLTWSASSDNVGVSLYEVRRDAVSLGTTANTTMPISGLSPGTLYAMSVRARDATGNWSAWTVDFPVTTTDTQAPTVPSGLAAGSIATNSFTLTWTASSDNVGVTAYEVMRGGTSLGNVPSPSMSITGLAAETAYLMTVRARDAVGNWSAWSSNLTVTTTAATAGPPVISSPATAVGFVGSPFSFAIEASNTPTGYAVTGALPPGLALSSLTTVNDDHAAISYSAGWAVSSNRQSYSNYPETDIGGDVHYAVNNGDFASFTFTGSSVKFISETYSDEGTVDVYIDGSFDRTVNCYSATRLSRQAVYTRSDLTAGAHVIKVVKTGGGCILVDGFISGTPNLIVGTPTTVGTWSVSISASNAGGTTSATLGITINPTADTQAPTIPAGLNASSVGSTGLTLGWSAATDNVGVTGYEVRKDGILQATTASTATILTGLMPSTTYSMTVRARDAAGNWSAWSTALNVTTSAPSATTDTDGDGVPDVIEQQLGTNPNATRQADSANQSALKIHRPNP